MAAVTHAITTNSTANTTSYASGSFTPAANDLLIVFVYASGTLNTGTLTDSQGIGFTKITSATRQTTADTLYAFIANGLAAASAMTVTFGCAGDAATGAIIQVARVSGMSLTGITAVKQSITVNDHASGTPAATFNASVLTGNPTFGFTANSTNPSGITNPTSWTTGADDGFLTPTRGANYVYRNSGFTGTTITWGSSAGATYGVILVELNTQAAPTIVLNTADATAFATATPALESTATDTNSDDVAYELQVNTSSSFPTLSAANLTSGEDNTSGTDATTASVSPTANRLQLLTVVARKDTSQPIDPTVSGNSLTWVLVASKYFDTSSSSRKQMWVFRAMGSSPTTGAITITFGETWTNCSWSLDEITDANISGTNGSGAIGGYTTGSEDAGNGGELSLGFNITGNTNALVFGAFAADPGTGTVTVGSGFTKLGAKDNSTMNLGTQYKIGNTTVVNATVDSVAGTSTGGIAIVIKPRIPTLNKVSAASSVTDVITSSGYWICPLGVTSIAVEAWGGGAGSGAGGGGTWGAGGGGAYSKLNSFSVTPGNAYAVTVGAGGLFRLWNTDSGAGRDGSDSGFDDNTQLLAKGGSGSATSAGGAGGAAGSGFGDTKYSGGNGGASASSAGGGGGGGAGSTGAGGTGTDGVFPTPGAGGTGTSSGGGNGGSGGSVSGSTYGGGAGAPNNAATDSASGAQGLVQIIYTPSDTGYANTVTGGDTSPFNSGEKVSFTVQAGDSLADGTYYWRARAKDPNGLNTYSSWTSSRSFTVALSTIRNKINFIKQAIMRSNNY